MANSAALTNFSGYTVDGTLFSSSRTIVRKAVRDSDQKEVILKILNSEYPSPAELSQFRYEYELLKECQCEGVIESYELGTVGNSAFIAMEDIGGRDLAAWMSDNPNRSIETSLNIALLIAGALGEIHTKNIIHKDINPTNILFNPETNTVKIIDFGISSFLPRETVSQKSPDQLEGSLLYIAPEQTGRINRAVDYRSDFYSLGVTLYELFTGTVPFSAGDNLELIHCHIAKTAQSPSQINSKIPEPLSKIIMKLMAKESDARYQSAFGVIHDLTLCRDSLEKSGTIPSFEPGSQDISARIQIPQKLYGREKDIAALTNSLNRVTEGTAGIVTISGFSGIGKTALVNEVYRTVTLKNGCVIRGKFDQFQHNVPYSAVIVAFRELVAMLLTESESSLEKWRTELAEALGSNGAVITEVLPEIELIIGRQEPVPVLGAAESQKRFTMVFQNFMRVFCRPEHPVVIFLDDLQWVDSASLNLIEYLTADPEQNSLVLILAYRDNEVDPTHQFMAALDKIRKKGITIDEISLTPLVSNDIADLLSDTLHRTEADTASLTQLIVEKTGGNPFFVQQFILTLAQENLLTLVHPTTDSEGFWLWDIEKIKARNISDNVVELMVSKLKQLPESAQTTIALASAIGNRFDLADLAVIAERSPEQTFSDLLPLLKSGVILPSAESKTEKITADYARSFLFLHDRVQQAAYELIEVAKRAELHLKIGRLLVQNREADYVESTIFEITGHFNKAIDLITDPAEIRDLIRFNLRSGIKSRGFSSYDASFEYLKIAFDLLPKNAWETEYDFAFELSMEYCQSGFLATKFGEAEKVLNEMIVKVKTPYERAQIYRMQANQYIALERTADSLPLLIKGLEELGLSIPLKPSPIHLIKNMLKVNGLKGKKTADDIASIPKITDKSQLLVTEILSDMILPAFLTENETLFALVSLLQVRFSFEYGTNPRSAFAFTSYGIMLNSMGKYKEAKEAGDIGLKINDLFAGNESKCGTHFMYTFYIHFLNNPVIELSDYFKKTVEIGKHSGELFWLSWAMANASARCWDVPIETELKQLQNYLPQIQKLGYLDASDAVHTLIQCDKALLGQTNGLTSLSDADYNEEEVIEKLINLHKSDVLAPLFLFRCKVAFLHGDYTRARAQVPEIDKRRKVLDGNADSITHATYAFLSEAACYPTLTSSEKKKSMKRMLEDYKRVSKRAAHYPPNFEHLRDFMTAELARISGDTAAVQKFYPKAIAGAKAAQWLQHEAIYNERFAEYWFDQGNEQVGNLYIREAHYRYQVWGAKVKVGLLEEKYDILRNRQNFLGAQTTHPHTSRSRIGTSSISSTDGIDLQSFLKASNTLSGEIILSSLLEKMIHIVIENAGAERGVLLLPKNGIWCIEAEGYSSSDETTILHSIAVEGSTLLPESVIHYVARTGENVVLQNGSLEGTFVKDPYMINRAPKSILCTPLFNQGVLTGILYLENNLTTGAFTSQRVAISNLLSSQIAISIQNSILYNRLEEKVEERTRELEEQAEELKREKERADSANEAKSTFLANMSHEIRTPMNAILGFAEILKERITDPQSCRYLTTIQTSGNALLNLINDILDLSKIEAGKMELNAMPASVKDLAMEMHTIFFHKMDAKGVQFTLDLDDSIPAALIMDESRLRQILINLIGNAVKFTNDGSITLRVRSAEISGIQSRVNLTITVEDTGIGIPEDQQEKIFLAFEQVSSQTSAQYGGTGLGLSISKRLTEMMKGSITCSSVPGKGTRFTVTVPDIEISAGEALSKQEHTLDYSAVNFEPAAILIADDVDYNREMIAAYLAEWPFTILFAADGKEAIALAGEKNPDLILMDMKMPVMDGFEASQRLKSDDTLKKIPLIAVTASAFKEDENRISRYCDGYLRKPVSKSRLIRELMKHLAHSAGEPAEIIEAGEPAAENAPSHETLSALYETAVSGYIHELGEMAHKVKLENPGTAQFCDKLIKMASSYDDESILTLLKKHLNKL